MRRAVLAALIVALATAGPAAAAHHLKATATLAPPVQLFGNTVTARVSVVTDTTHVDPARLHVIAKFSPYRPVGPPKEVQVASGRYVQTTWTWKLSCLIAVCVPLGSASSPSAPSAVASHVFSFPPAQVRGLGSNGKTTYRAHLFFPQLELLSQLSPREAAYLKAHKHIQWQYPLAPAVGDAYRLPPGLVFWLAVVLAGLCGAGALVVGGRWALRLRQPAVSATPGVPTPYLERALALFFWANAHGDETLQRKALERVADELPFDVHELSETAHALAWSPETPDEEDVQAISQRAGVAVRPEERNGA
jgi:hypothetical protein